MRKGKKRGRRMWDWVREMKESKPLWWYLAHSSWAQHTLLVQEPRAPAAEGWGLQRNCRETSKPWWAFQPIRSLDIQMFPGAWRGRWQGVLRKRETSKQANKKACFLKQVTLDCFLLILSLGICAEEMLEEVLLRLWLCSDTEWLLRSDRQAKLQP